MKINESNQKILGFFPHPGKLKNKSFSGSFNIGLAKN
jgi:hypothetical protein